MIPNWREKKTKKIINLFVDKKNKKNIEYPDERTVTLSSVPFNGNNHFTNAIFSPSYPNRYDLCPSPSFRCVCFHLTLSYVAVYPFPFCIQQNKNTILMFIQLFCIVVRLPSVLKLNFLSSSTIFFPSSILYTWVLYYSHWNLLVILLS